MSASNGQHAIVVDDSQVARVLLERMLENEGFKVVGLESGEACLDYLESRTTDVIFMDHMMPGMDGFEAVKKIREQPRLTKIPVFMYTAKAGDSYRRRARELGAAGVIAKSVESPELMRKLEKAGVIQHHPEPARPSPVNTSKPEPQEDSVTSTLRISSEELDFDLDESADLVEITEAATEQSPDRQLQKTLFRGLSRQRELFQQDMHNFSEQLTQKLNREYADDHRVLVDFFDQQAKQEHSPWHTAKTLGKYAAMILLTAFTVSLLVNDQVPSQAIATANPEAMAVVVNENNNLRDQLEKEDVESDVRDEIFYRGLESVYNRLSDFDYQQNPFSLTTKQATRALFDTLAETDFSGDVLFTVHFGNFCLQPSSNGQWRLADADTPVSECEFLDSGGVRALADEASVSTEVSGLAAQMDSRTRNRVRVVLSDTTNQSPRFRYPEQSGTTAGEWNRIAQRNQRVEIALRE